MQITNDFSGESKNQFPKFLPPLKKAFMHRSAVSKGVCALTVHAVFIMERICEDIHLIKSGGVLLIKPIAVLREKRMLTVWRL